MKTVSVLLAVLVFVMFGAAVSRAEELDPSKALVGKWEGQYVKDPADVSGDNARTLVIVRVQQQDGKWVVSEAKWGISGGRLAPVEVKLEVIDGVPTIHFEPTPMNPVMLRLTPEGLTGTIKMLSRGRGGWGVRPMKLKRVE